MMDITYMQSKTVKKGNTIQVKKISTKGPMDPSKFELLFYVTPNFICFLTLITSSFKSIGF
jgi:hypothetical protein